MSVLQIRHKMDVRNFFGAVRKKEIHFANMGCTEAFPDWVRREGYSRSQDTGDERVYTELLR